MSSIIFLLLKFVFIYTYSFLGAQNELLVVTVLRNMIGPHETIGKSLCYLI